MIRKELGFLGLKLVLMAGVIVLLFGVIFGFCQTQDDSMNPTIKEGDLILYYRLQKNYQHSDVVVVQKEGTVQIRRIIATEGDQVDITEDGLKINGYLQQETQIYEETLPYVGAISFPVIVGKDEYFVLGDERKTAEDSRIYGSVKKEEIKGGIISLFRRRGL